MQIKRFLIAGMASMLAASAWAQTAPPAKPLDLRLPPQSIPSAKSASAPARATSAASAAHPGSVAHAHVPSRSQAAQPGVYYGDTSGTRADRDALTDVPTCDDSTYNQTQVHGSVGMGVVAGNHVSGNYQTGTINLSKALGSCDQPTGGVSISIGVGQGDFHGGSRRGGRR